VSSFHFLLAPLIAAAALGIMVLICRWVFSTDQREVSTSSNRSGDGYGLLVPVATVRTRDDAEMLRDVLCQAGVRAGVSEEAGELQVLVFTKDLARARSLVAAV
jgi:hypothetical protein